MWGLPVILLVWLSVSCGGRLARRTCLDSVLHKYQLSDYSLHTNMITHACDAFAYNDRVLQEFSPICYANHTYFYPCSRWTTEAPARVSLEWHGHVMANKTNPSDFQRLLSAHPVDWLNGTSYGTAILYFPHAAQALIPMLNIPLLGTSLRRFVVNHFYSDADRQRTWEQHYYMFHRSRWLTQLLESLLECLGVTMRRGDEAFYHDYNAHAPPSDILPPRPSPSRLLCFERLIMPYNQLTCNKHFVTPTHAPAVWAAFRASVFARFRVRPLPRSPLRIAFLERERDRRILNQAELIEAIRRTTGAEVVALRFTSDMGLDVQVRSVSSFHIVLGSHGANMMNCLFLSPGAIAIEVYPQNEWMRCYYGEVLRSSGVRYRRFCSPSGPCALQPKSPHWEYPRQDANISVPALMSVILSAVRDVRAKGLAAT
eukprot:EG_transcript_11243